MQDTIEERKVCTKCLEKKDLGEFLTCANGRWRRGVCRACGRTNTKAWYAAHPEAKKIYRKRRRAKQKQGLELIRGVGYTPDVDVLRRALVECPPELHGEGERLAYFRGFMAAAKRNKEETERFERLKDLPHRIASEKASQRGIGYEEAVSAAYEGLLVFLRSREVSFSSLEQERAYAAKKIRWSIDDYKRTEGPSRRGGGLRWIGGEDSISENGGSLVADVATARDELDEEAMRLVIARAHTAPDGRLPAIVKRRSEGASLAEIGSELGLSESSICKIISGNRPWLEENILPLIESA